MPAQFECEVRFYIKDLNAFKKRLRQLNAIFLHPYAFTDYYYEPKNKKWNPKINNLRIREWQKPKKPTGIFFVKNQIIKSRERQFKRSTYQDGKVPLFFGSLKTCQKLLKDLEFRPIFKIKKERCLFWDLPNYKFKTIAEYVKGIGWTGELEFAGNDPKKAGKQINQALKILQIPPELVTFKTMSALFLENKKT